MACKLVAMAQRRWRRLNGAHLRSLVRPGVVFVDGVIQTERESQQRRFATSGKPICRKEPNG